VSQQVLYAQSGDINIAYRVFGEGPADIVVVPGFISHMEIVGEYPPMRRMMERLGRIARVIVFDKRGTGMSDPVANVPALEQRMDDVRAVMDAAGSERAVLLGISEGAPMCAMFAATYPARIISLILYGGMARSTWAPDYPWAPPQEAARQAMAEFTRPAWGSGDNAEVFAPTAAADPAVREWWGRLERNGASPSMMQKIFEMFLETDVRETLPSVHAPTLVLHRKGDRVVNVGAGRWLAEHIDGARFVELQGSDHAPWAGNTDALLGEIEEFVTGVRAVSSEDVDRVLRTVMFIDLVASTERASSLGDRGWRDLLESYYAVVRRELAHFKGKEIKTIGDGFLAIFEGPARAIHSAQAIISGITSLGLELRAGLHAGECELMDDDVGGIAVHIASRIISNALPGEVLVSSTVKDLVVGSGIRFADRGVHGLKGVPGEWQLYAARS
jgi:pimeloyl-ACP methyl ester carboxylesterase